VIDGKTCSTQIDRVYQDQLFSVFATH